MFTRSGLLTLPNSSTIICFSRKRNHHHVTRACLVLNKSVRKCAPLLHGGPSTGEWRAVPDLWKSSAERFGDRVALVEPHREPPCQMTYVQIEQAILSFAEAIRTLGVSPDEHVALFADNSSRWLVADQGIMAMGAANAVRGSRSSNEELLYILNHSDSVALVVDTPELLSKLGPRVHSSTTLKFIILLWGAKPDNLNVPVYTYEECISLGENSRREPLYTDEEFAPIQPHDIATIVYTSGTTGNPKGVKLTHGNILHQVKHLVHCIQPEPGDRFLSLLPPWHMYERSAEYFIFTRGIEQVYTSVKFLQEDLRTYPAQYFVSVPLVYETLYSGVQKQISKSSSLRKAFLMSMFSISALYMELQRVHKGRAISRALQAPHALTARALCFMAGLMAKLLFVFHLLGDKIVYSKVRKAFGISKSGISGGGSLPSHVDKFFEIVGITLLNGYGLTESSPVLATRALPDNILGSVGTALPFTEVKVVHPENKDTLKDGVKGIVMVRGPQVMTEYYKNSSATCKVLDNEGWLDTGDLGWLSPSWDFGPARKCKGVLVLEGRAKDTIVLTTGENVEPVEIEEAALQSELIQQIMVVGQDQRRLGALIVVNKDEAVKHGDKLRNVLRQELNKWIGASGCSLQVGPFSLVDEPFTIDNGLLTPTMKLKRDAIASKYSEPINRLFSS